jgi:tripartite motif-containing protein 71
MAEVFNRKWGSEGSGDGQFEQPFGINVYNDEVYVVDQNNSRVQVFDLDGTFKRKFGEDHFYVPQSIIVHNNEVFVADGIDTAPHRIIVFGTDGTFVREWIIPAIGWPLPVYVDINIYNDEVFTADTGAFSASKIRVFTLDGTLKRDWSVEQPWSIFVYSDEVFVSYNSSIKIFDLNGALKREQVWSESVEPSSMNIYNDEIFVCDDLTTSIKVFALDGTFKRAFGGSGSGDGQFIQLGGVCVYTGEVYITDYYGHRVQVFSLFAPTSVIITLSSSALVCNRTVTHKTSGTSTTSPASTTSITSPKVPVSEPGLRDIVFVTPPGTPKTPERIPAMSKPPFFPIQTKWG